MKKPLVMLGVVAAGALAVKLWIGAGVDDRSASEPGLILDRVWVDHLPSGDRDTVNAFAAVTREPIGIFQSTSQWKGSYELFQYEASGAELRVVFPQTGDKEKVRARAWSCKERGMDFCLELAGSSRGVKRYHSRKGWELGTSALAAQAIARVEAIVGAAGSASTP